ncbi:unnamed protein product [Prorocentrum cordatum]|uniref:CCHC-type domain-containing protein n=1 Tax=Prorocentrum cordatum TaxID=2364126 RepID=A0ABN9Y3G6_9DINO|nr:unnamed protein product [Polarella glacialis]
MSGEPKDGNGEGQRRAENLAGRKELSDGTVDSDVFTGEQKIELEQMMKQQLAQTEAMLLKYLGKHGASEKEEGVDRRPRDPWDSDDPWKGQSRSESQGGERREWSQEEWDEWKKAKGGRYESDWRDQKWEKGDYTDPEAFMGWSDYRLWRRRVVRWLDQTDVPPRKRSDKILKVLDRDLQRKFEDISDAVLQSAEGPMTIIKRLDIMSGQRIDDEKRRAGRECLMGYRRKADETLSVYTARMDQNFERLKGQGLELDDSWKILFLEEGIGLDESGMQMLKVMSRGSKDYEEVIGAAREMDVTRNEHLGARTGKATAATYALQDDDDDLCEYSDVSSMTSEQEAFVLESIAEADVDEYELPEVLATLEKDRKKTWKENRDYKRHLRVDRKFYQTPGGPSGPRAPAPPPPHPGRRDGLHRSAKGIVRERKRRLPIEKRMKITKCHRCHKKGHWSRECPEKGDSTGAAAGSGFALLNESEPSYAILASENINSINARGLIHQVVDRIKSEKVEAMSLLVTGSGGIVVDTAAGQALIGPQALQRLEKRLGELGFRVVRVKSKHQFARGVGGKTPVQSGLLVPTGIEGKTGIMELDLIEQDVPALMPISMQEQMKAVIDLPKAEMTLRALGVTTSLKRLSSGHRTIAIDKLGSPEDFELPEAVRKRFGLQASDFRLSSSENAMVTYWNRAEKTFLQAMTGSTASDSGEPQCVKYLLTGNEHPSGLSVGDKFWAYLSSRIVADHQHKGLKLLHMFQNGHQWPIKTKKADRFYTERQMKCSHSWARLISFGNSHGSWEVCGDCDMRVSYFQKASVIYKGKGKSPQSGSTVLNASDLTKPPGGRASVRNSVECTRVALMTTTSDRGPTQGSEEPMRVKKRSEEMVQYRALEAPMEVDSTGPARPRQHAPRASLISEIKSMKEEMTNQNHGLLALVVEQGKAIQHIQAAQLGIQEKQAMMEKQMAIEDQPKTLPPQVPAQRTKQSLKDGRCLYGLSELPEDHPTVKDGFQEGRSFHQRDSFQEGCSFHQRDSFQEGGSFHQTDSFPIRNEKFRDPSKTDLREHPPAPRLA